MVNYIFKVKGNVLGHDKTLGSIYSTRKETVSPC
jgi:hypothetical protein